MEQTTSIGASQATGKTRRRLRKIRPVKVVFIVSMLAYPVLQFLVFWLYVNISTITMTFQKFDFPSQQTVFAGFENYRRLFTELFTDDFNPLRRGLINSLLLFPFNNFILLPVSIVCAYLLFKKVFGYQVFRVVFFFPSIISIVVLTMVFQFMLDSTFGPVNKLLDAMRLTWIIPEGGWLGSKNSFPVILFYCLWAGIGYNVVLLTGAVQRIPTEILESGRIDGIGMGRELVSVVVPLIFPTISTLFVVGTTVVFTLFLQPMLINNGGINFSSTTVAHQIVLLTQTNANLEKAATIGLTFSILGLPVIWGIKYLMEKITPQVEY